MSPILEDAASQLVQAPDGAISDLTGCLPSFYAKFLADLSLPVQPETFESDVLMKAVLEFAATTGVPHHLKSRSYGALMLGNSYADLKNCLPYHDLEVKVFVAIYTWLAILCDDAPQAGTVPALERFQQLWMEGKEQPTILLRAFANQLRLSYKLYHPLVANLIVSSSFSFLTAIAIGNRQGIQRKLAHPSRGGDGFCWYMRARDGDGEAYAWFAYPKSQFPNLDTPIEAIEDMSRCFDLVNDVLSFYKEVANGETDTYIHRRAAYAKSGLYAALEKTAQDVIGCIHRIRAVLKGKGIYERAWWLYITGYIQWHISVERYKLCEVGVESL
ncbi:hypothetical protein MY11210_008139 [Beauveria gryllotalpidicola]